MKGLRNWAGALARSVGESVALAAGQFRSDRFRTGLTLAGIAIGIFSTVGALTLVDSVQRCINEGFADFGGDVVLVEQVPLEPDFDEEGSLRWWDSRLSHHLDRDQLPQYRGVLHLAQSDQRRIVAIGVPRRDYHLGHAVQLSVQFVPGPMPLAGGRKLFVANGRVIGRIEAVLLIPEHKDGAHQKGGPEHQKFHSAHSYLHCYVLDKGSLSRLLQQMFFDRSGTIY